MFLIKAPLSDRRCTGDLVSSIQLDIHIAKQPLRTAPTYNNYYNIYIFYSVFLRTPQNYMV